MLKFIKISKLIYKLSTYSSTNTFSFLPYNFGKIKSFFLSRFFSRIKIEKEQTNLIKTIPKNSIIIYVTKNQNTFEYFFTISRYKKLGFPVPQIAFNYRIYLLQNISKFFKILLLNIFYLITKRKTLDPYTTQQYKINLLTYKCGFFSLVEKKGFYLRFIKRKEDPLSHLIKIQRKLNFPIYIIPQIIFFDRKPIPIEPSLIDILFGNSQHPGFVRKTFILVKFPSKIFVELSDPINLMKWLEKSNCQNLKLKYQTLMLRRKVLLQQNRHRHVITGPSLKSKEEIKESILTNQRMRRFMKQFSKIEKTSLYKTRKKANSYVNEIAAKYNPNSIKLMSRIVHWIVNATFDGTVVDSTGIKKIKEILREGPIILVPCHKSHIDYLILSYLLYNNKITCPHIAAGKNLSFWPLGPIFRSGGAFFIRRSFKGQKLYAKVFSEYVRKLLEEGFNIEIFIEGGRSRTGKLLTPKLGLISILLDAFKSGACRNMFFVPVYIGYDRVIEEYAYIHEISGGNKSPETFSQVIKARKFLKKRYGKIYINFDKPVSIKKFITSNSTDIKSHKLNNVIICKNIAKHIMTAINKKTVITPHALTAAAILNFPKSNFTRNTIIEIAKDYLFFALTQHAKISDTLAVAPNSALKNAFSDYKNRKTIEKAKHSKAKFLSSNPLYLVKENKRPLLDFYKNNCISFFVRGATVSLAILKKNIFQISASDLYQQYKSLINLFKYEFTIEIEKSPEAIVRKTIKAFIDNSILLPHKTIPETYNITSSGHKKIKLYATFLKPYFESYLIVLKFLKTKTENNLALNKKEQIKKIQSLGIQCYKRGEIDLIESISKNNYSNAIKYFIYDENMKYIYIQRYHDKIVEQLKLINKKDFK